MPSNKTTESLNVTEKLRIMNEKYGVKLLAVLLTVHNRKDTTVKCLQCLLAQRIPEWVQTDIYMVDDGSTDGTGQVVMELFPDVNIIQGDGTLYWNRGMWTAWETASQNKKYDFFLWLNDDTFLLDNALVEMLTLSGKKNDAAIIVGATKASESDKLTYGGHTQSGIPECDGVPHEVTIFNGNIVLVPSAVYDKLGNVDYYYRHGKGDYDYAVRAVKAGIKMYQCGVVLGLCDEHEHIDAWCNPQVPFVKRWKAMHQPTGMQPLEWFHYEKQLNVCSALFHMLTMYVRCVFPTYWVKRGK